MRFSFRGVLLAMAALLALAGCGGGSGGGTPTLPTSGSCPPEQFTAESVTYPSADVSRVLRADVGMAFDSGLPSLPDLEASCRARLGFRVRPDTELPAGLQLDAATGRISGIGTATGFYGPTIELTLDGVPAFTAPSFWVAVADPARYTLSGWTAKEMPPSGVGGALSASDNRLLLTTTGDGGVTLASLDRGTSWNQLAGGAPTPARAFFAIGDDGHSVYLAGGRGTAPVNDVWKFDGTTWLLRTATAPYPARTGHAIVKLNGALYVIGGANPFGHDPGFGDVWKSVDEGATWQQSAIPFPGVPVTCAAVFQGRLAVLADGVWSSDDGTSWVRQPYSVNNPLSAVTQRGGARCGVANGRLYVVGREFIASTADLLQWQFEPSLPGVSVSDFDGPGLAVVGGRLYVSETPAQAGLPSRIFESAP